MQPTEQYSVPRRALDVEDYIDVVRRHKGWIFGPFLFTLVASVVGVYLWPDSYNSQAVVKIVPQQVPTTMVQSAVNQQMADRINSMAQTILSRTTLTTIINTFGLYPRERSRMPIEDVIELMRKKIEINPVATSAGTTVVPAFAVSFSYEDRHLAQRVVQDLVSRFIDENIRNRSNATFQTTQFIKDELDDSKKELDGAESRLASFRMQNNGKLPDQLDSNMRQLTSLQAQVTYLDNNINRAQQDKLQIESNIRITKDQLAALTKDSPDPFAQQQKSQRLAAAERDVEAAETALATLRTQYKDTYPDVQAAIGRVTVAKQNRDNVLKEENTEAESKPKPSKNQSPDFTRETRDMEATIQRLQALEESREMDIQNYNKDMKKTNDAIKAYQGRIETVPLGEKQYSDLLRDESIAREKYVDLSGKLQRAEIAQEMEGRKQGETLELLDPASLPSTPTEPRRPLVISIGAALGLMLGIVMAGGREMKDSSLKNLKDVRAYTQMAILGSVPLLENDFVVRRRRRLAWLGWTTAGLAAAIVMSGSIVYYYMTKA